MTLVMLAAFAACGDSDTTSPSASLAGTYNLSLVNGAALPFLVQASNPKIELVAEQLVVNSAGTFTIATTRRNTPTTGSATTTTTNGGGTYSTSGGVTTFHFDGGNTGTATLSANALTIATTTGSSVYVR